MNNRLRADIHVETLPEQLRNLSDDDLVGQLQLAIRGEQRMTILVLYHLNEVERRSLHLDRGYSSLFDYCVRKLKYSESAAGRRIQAARCIRRFPEVLGMLQAHELSLSTISLIEPILTDDNVGSIIERVRGASYRDVEAIASEYRPPLALRDRVRSVRVSVPAADVDTALLERECARITPGAGSAHVATEQKLYVQFLADEEFMALFEDVRSLLSANGEYRSFSDVIKVVLGAYRERHSPVARQQRREARSRGS